MPIKAKTVCCKPGCGALTEGRFCETHRIERERQYKAAYKQKSGKADGFYSKRSWRRFRKWFLSRHPVCERCGAFANEVHHKVDRRVAELTYREDNCEALCKSCHSRETAKETRRW